MARDGRRCWIDDPKYPVRDARGRTVGTLDIAPEIRDRTSAERTMRESEESLREAQRIAGLGSYFVDAGMTHWNTSEALDELLGLDEHFDRSLAGWLSLVHPQDREMVKETLMACVAGRIPSSATEYRVIRRSDQQVRWIHATRRMEYDALGRLVRLHGTLQDITAQKQIEEQLRLAASVFTHAAEGILITDVHGNILEVNEAFTRVTGYAREEVLGKNPRILRSGLQSRAFYESMWQTLANNGQWKGEIWNRNKIGDIYAEELTINAIRDTEGGIVQYVALFSDVTQLKDRERQLAQLAHYDALTGLPNRSLLLDRLRQGMAQAHRRNQMLAVASLDLDGFKPVNDKHGFEIGDRLLTALARRLRLALREGDTLARLGGDEFVVVLTDLQSLEDALPVISRMLKDVAARVRIGGLNLRVTASIGVAVYRDAEEADAEQLLRQAGQALFEAKAGGRNRYALFSPSSDERSGHRLEILRIHRALAQNEFVLHYQPKVNMRTGAVVGAEALIRWQHPERGLLLPGAFLPLVENDPFSINLGEWVMETALQQMEDWQQAGLDLQVSVNMGALQLQQKDFPERLRRLLAAHPAVKPSSFELEVLESSAFQDLVQASDLLDSCHTMGVSFAIDDFGTGYASLTYLKRLPVQTVKIDRSFVCDMLDNPENLTILEGVLGLATAFRRHIVAEGVETAEQGWMLLQLGCHTAQGYGIARPMPAGELPGWVKRWQPDPRWTDCPPLNSGNRTLLFACVEHRTWLGAFESYLQGKRPAPPALDPGECRLGSLLENEKLAGRTDPNAIAAIQTLHDQLHELAAEIMASQAEGGNSTGLARLGALHCLEHEFLEQLTSLN